MKAHKIYISLLLGIFIYTSHINNSISSDTAEFNIKDQEVEKVFKTSFEIPLQFRADLGNLSLSIRNSTEEKDIGYIRAHNLSSWLTFWKNSHQMLLKDLEITQPLMETRKLSMSQRSTLDGIMQEYLDETKSLDSPIIPIRLQGDFSIKQKYALPNSILSLAWHFDLLPPKDPPADLDMFRTTEQFYIYVHNTFVEEVNKISSSKEDKRFEELKNFMYL